MPTPSLVPFKAGKALRLGNGALSTAPSFRKPLDGLGCGAGSGFPSAINRTSSSLVRPSGSTSPRRKMSNIGSRLSAAFCHGWTTARISFADRPREPVSNRCHFQVTHLQVPDLQWDATGTVFGLMPSKSALSLAPSSHPACGVLTIDTNPPLTFEARLQSLERKLESQFTAARKEPAR